MAETTEKVAQHTPGPWHAEINTITRFGGPRISADGSSPKSLAIADLWHMEGHGSTEANARLIAAAPELLEALKMADRCLRGYAESAEEASKVEAVVEAAIRKAEGQ